MMVEYLTCSGVDVVSISPHKLEHPAPAARNGAHVGSSKAYAWGRKASAEGYQGDTGDRTERRSKVTCAHTGKVGV